MDQRLLLVDGMLQVVDDLSNLSGCYSSVVGSGDGWLSGRRACVGVVASDTPQADAAGQESYPS